MAQSLRIDDFKAKLQGGGARPNLFYVTFASPAVSGDIPEEAGFLCKSAALPASTVAQIDVPFRGRQLKVAGDRTFENWSTTIINDNTFSVRRGIETWLNSINSHVGNVSESVNPTDYYADFEVTQVDHQFRPVKRYKIVGAFPVNLGSIELSYDSSDTIEEFECEWAYQYWTSGETDGEDSARLNFNISYGGISAGGRLGI
jgi:hypothetical protein